MSLPHCSCRRRQTERKDSKTYVLQPGSTVATSLCEGEAARKHVFLLEVAVRLCEGGHVFLLEVAVRLPAACR